MADRYRKANDTDASTESSDSEDHSGSQYVLVGQANTRGRHDDRTPTVATYQTVSNREDHSPEVRRRGDDPHATLVGPRTGQSGLPGHPFDEASDFASQSPLHQAVSNQPYASSSIYKAANDDDDNGLRPPGLWDSTSTVYLSAMPTPMPHSDEKPPLTRDEQDSNYQPRNGIVDLGVDTAQESGDHRPTVKMKLPRDSDVHDVSYTYSRPPFQTQDSETALSSGFTSPNGTDYEDSSDEYDWSGEEDLAEEAERYVEKFGKKKKRTGWGPKRLFSLAFSSLVGSTLTAGLVALPAILVHFYWYKPNPTDDRKYITQNVEAWLFWVASNIVISWYLAMIIDVIPIIVQYFLSAAWGHVSEAVKSRMETYEAVKNTAKPAFYAASWLASWYIIFEHIYGLYNEEEGVESRAPYTERLSQVVLFFFFLVLVMCVQKMLTHYVAFNFHTVAYKDRIEVVEKRLSVVEKLQQYKPKKQHGKNASTASGIRTPFSSHRMSGSHLPYDMNVLTDRLHALGATRPPVSRLASNVAIPQTDDDNDGDKEDNEKTLVEKKGKSKKARKSNSWFKRAKKPSPEDPISLQELALEEKENEFKGISIHRGGNSPVDMHPGSPSGFASGSGFNDTNSPSGSHTRSKSGTPDRAALVSVGKALKNAVLHDARNISGQEQDLSALSWNVTSTSEAKRLAKTLFNRLRDRRRKYLIPSDFYPAFPTREEAEEAFNVIDEDGNGDLSRPEIKRVLVKTYQERRFLSRSLKDAGVALKTLDWILFFVAMVILFLISFSIFGVNVGDSLTSVYSVLIAASFIFKNSASKAFDAIMFLFVTHPFDTGDRVFVLEENLTVKKMGLFATTFTRSDGTETYYFNSMLFKQFITNARRSGKTTEMMNMQVAWRTPLAKLDALEKYLNDWISTEENRWYLPTGVTLQHIIYQKYLTLTVGIAHNGNWQDWGLRNARKTTFQAAVQSYCRELGIIGYEAPMPITYSEPNPVSTDDTLSAMMDDDNASIAPSIEQQKLEQDIEEAAKSVKASLGFLPPLPERSNRLLRARKSRHSKKHRLQAMNAEC